MSKFKCSRKIRQFTQAWCFQAFANFLEKSFQIKQEGVIFHEYRQARLLLKEPGSNLTTALSSRHSHGAGGNKDVFTISNLTLPKRHP